jgi:uracil-DNA glycosylase
MAHKTSGVVMNKICEMQCEDINYIGYTTKKTIYDDKINVVLISEAMPENLKNYYDQGIDNSYIKNTNALFEKNGVKLKSFTDYLKNGIYLTTALKCSKKEYLVKAKTIEYCSYILENEISRFRNVRVFLLMGDFAIKGMNYITKRKMKIKVIPNGSTYKIRNEKYIVNNVLYIPSYTQTGDSFGIEKSKVQMMEEDIKKALEYIGK